MKKSQILNPKRIKISQELAEKRSQQREFRARAKEQQLRLIPDYIESAFSRIKERFL